MHDYPEDHLSACWRISNCNNCINSSHGCGWCASSSACVPASSLLEPITNSHICPSRNERFELRTRALGCGCSTTTLLSVIVTVFATIVALGVLYGIGVLVYKANSTFGTGTWRGIEVEIKDDGTKTEKQWKRSSDSRLAKLFGRSGFNPKSSKSEQEQVTERTRLLG